MKQFLTVEKGTPDEATFVTTDCDKVYFANKPKPVCTDVAIGDYAGNALKAEVRFERIFINGLIKIHVFPLIAM